MVGGIHEADRGDFDATESSAIAARIGWQFANHSTTPRKAAEVNDDSAPGQTAGRKAAQNGDGLTRPRVS
jgi:hypothetical protein